MQISSDMTAYISGGTSGIGLGIAQAIAARGGRVLVFGRDPVKAVQAAVEIEEAYHTVTMPGVADVRDADAVQSLFGRAVDKIGPPDLIVAGAAGNFMTPAAKMSANGFKSVVDIDLLGTFNVFRAGVDIIKRPGSMIAITAPQATLPMVQQVHVCAAKAGVNMVVKVLAAEWGPAGIRVNAVSPGPIAGTEGIARMAPSDEDKDAWIRQTALRRFGTVEEIAKVVLFLSSPAASYVTGTVFECDGGMSLCNAEGDWV
jgi:NAD(P)-dependent dehydrogenase (short-subunit alcohol dehydrogenase family)